MLLSLLLIFDKNTREFVGEKFMYLIFDIYFLDNFIINNV